EEILFRSFLYQRAATAAGVDAGLWSQALLYGLMAYRDGVPNGAAGFIIGSLFGLGTGYLVKKSRSVYLAMLVHLIVSLGVYVELVVLSR
ncbi:MAG: CPBP family intramembrane metalloprotease, partial [Calditrichaeota bacterium]